MSEFTPPTRWARMTKSQVKRYIKDLEEKRKKAQEKLDKAKKSKDWQKKKDDLENFENILDEL